MFRSIKVVYFCYQKRLQFQTRFAKTAHLQTVELKETARRKLDRIVHLNVIKVTSIIPTELSVERTRSGIQVMHAQVIVKLNGILSYNNTNELKVV